MPYVLLTLYAWRNLLWHWILTNVDIGDVVNMKTRHTGSSREVD